MKILAAAHTEGGREGGSERDGAIAFRAGVSLLLSSPLRPTTCACVYKDKDWIHPGFTLPNFEIGSRSLPDIAVRVFSRARRAHRSLPSPARGEGSIPAENWRAAAGRHDDDGGARADDDAGVFVGAV